MMKSLCLAVFLLVFNVIDSFNSHNYLYGKLNVYRRRIASNTAVFAKSKSPSTPNPQNEVIDDYSDDYDEKEIVPDIEKENEVEDEERKPLQISSKDLGSAQYVSLRRSRIKRQQNKIDQTIRDTTMGMLNFRPYLGEEDEGNEVLTEDISPDSEGDTSEEGQSAEEQRKALEEKNKEIIEMRKRSRMNVDKRYDTIKSIHNTSTAQFFQWYIVKVGRGSEEAVSNEINRLLSERDPIFLENVKETLVPKRRLPVLKKKSLEYAYTVYIPKQIYLRARLLPEVEWALTNIPGVYTVVQTRGDDVEEFILEKKKLMKRFERDEEFRLAHPIKVGDAVEVLDERGKPIGYGTFLGVDRSKCKVNVINDVGLDEVLQYVEIEQVKYLEPGESDIAAKKIHEALTAKEDVMQLSAKELLLKAMESAPNSRQLRYLMKNRQIASILNDADDKHRKPIAALSDEELSTLFQDNNDLFGRDRPRSSDREERSSRPFSKRSDDVREEDNGQRFRKRPEEEGFGDRRDRNSRSFSSPSQRYSSSDYSWTPRDDPDSLFPSSSSRGPYSSQGRDSSNSGESNQWIKKEEESRFGVDSGDEGVNSDDLDSIIDSLISDDEEKSQRGRGQDKDQGRRSPPTMNSAPRVQSHFIQPSNPGKGISDGKTRDIEKPWSAENFDFSDLLNEIDNEGSQGQGRSQSQPGEGDDVNSFDLDSIIQDFIEREKKDPPPTSQSSPSSGFTKSPQRNFAERRSGNRDNRDNLPRRAASPSSSQSYSSNQPQCRSPDSRSRNENKFNGREEATAGADYPLAIHFDSFEDYLSAVQRYEDRQRSPTKSEVVSSSTTAPLPAVKEGSRSSSASSTSSSNSQYEQKTIKELKDLLKDRKLPVSGSKAELIKRLSDA